MSKNKETQIEKQFVNKFVKLIGKDMVKYLPSKIIPALVALISIPVYTNLFPPEEYGIYSMAISAVSLISSILSGWLPYGAFRFYDEYKNENKETIFFTTIFTILFTINFITILLGILSYTFLNQYLADSNYIFIFSLFILITGPFMNIAKKILNADREIHIYSFLTILLPVGKLAFVLLFNKYLSFLGVSILILSTFLTEILIILIALFRIKPNFKLSFFNKKFSLKIFKFGFPLMLNFVLAWLISVSDRYIIGFFRSSEEVGLYSISYNIGNNSIKLVFMMLMLAAFPIIIKAWNKYDKDYVSILISKIIKYYYILTIPIVMALFILSPMLIDILSSEEYYQGYLVMPWVGLGIFFMGLSHYLHKIWELNEDTKIILIINVIAAIINIIFNLIFIPSFGFVAAGFSTFLSYLIYCIIAYKLSSKYINLEIFNINTIKILFSSIMMLVPVFLLNDILANNILSFIMIVVVGATVYFILLYFSNVIKKEVKIIINIILK